MFPLTLPQQVGPESVCVIVKVFGQIGAVMNDPLGSRPGLQIGQPMQYENLKIEGQLDGK